jgi:hypothetical protein
MMSIITWIGQQWRRINHTPTINSQLSPSTNDMASTTYLLNNDLTTPTKTLVTNNPWQQAWMVSTLDQMPPEARAGGGHVIDAQSSLDLLFPHQHNSDLSRDPALASARMQPTLKQTTQQNTNLDEVKEKQLTTWKDSNFPSLEAIRPKRETNLANYGNDKATVVSKPIASTTTVNTIAPVSQVSQQARPLESLANAIANLPNASTPSMPPSAGIKMEQSEARFFDELQPDLAALSSTTYSPQSNEDEGNEVMAHLIRRNRFLSNSINQLASQYFKNTQ